MSEGSGMIDASQVRLAVGMAGPETAEPASRRKKTAAELGPKEYCWGVGRRKKAIARVRIRPGSGKITVNGREADEFFVNPRDRNDIRKPLGRTDRLSAYDVWVNVQGGGSTGQAGAVLLGVARALIVAEPELYPLLKDGGYLTRDSRAKERKKYGRAAARRSFQFSKR